MIEIKLSIEPLPQPRARIVAYKKAIRQAATDALNGVVYGDDSQLVQCNIEKFTDNQPHIELTIQEYQNNKKAGY